MADGTCHRPFLFMYTFQITVRNEPLAMVRRAVDSIRKNAPTAPLIVVADGSGRDDVAKLCTSSDADFVAGEHLKLLYKGGRWWHRFATLAIKKDTKYVLKFDPDSIMWRPIRIEPFSDYFGTLGNFGYIQGGCQGFSRMFLEKIITSGILLDDSKMCDTRNWHADSAYQQMFQHMGYLSTDWTMWYIARELNVVADMWSEVNSKWKAVGPNKDLRYAVTHPHKMEE